LVNMKHFLRSILLTLNFVFLTMLPLLADFMVFQISMVARRVVDAMRPLRAQGDAGSAEASPYQARAPPITATALA
jgi:hypothetical protein